VRTIWVWVYQDNLGPRQKGYVVKKWGSQLYNIQLGNVLAVVNKNSYLKSRAPNFLKSV
jgi:hypothetical protein